MGPEGHGQGGERERRRNTDERIAPSFTDELSHGSGSAHYVASVLTLFAVKVTLTRKTPNGYYPG